MWSWILAILACSSGAPKAAAPTAQDTAASTDADSAPSGETAADTGGSDTADTGHPQDTGPGFRAGADTPQPLADLDGDGLPDETEQRLAERYLPFISPASSEGCPTMGILFRASPSPLDATKVHILYDMLYDNDCGLGGHVGDDEVFAITVDPSVPPPEGILAMVAISHQDTLCEDVTTCGCGDGLDACTTTAWMGKLWPTVFPSLDKHGNYLSESSCDGACFWTNWCDTATTPLSPMLINAGEPDAPLTRDLTTSGLITSENGWTNAELFDYDPWGGADFGGAGNVAGDLVDPAFDTVVPICGGS